MTTMLQHL